jgi:hypothetical protein
LGEGGVRSENERSLFSAEPVTEPEPGGELKIVCSGEEGLLADEREELLPGERKNLLPCTRGGVFSSLYFLFVGVVSFSGVNCSEAIDII